MNDIEKKIISQMLDALIRRAAPKATTAEKYGGILYTMKPGDEEGQNCGIFEYTNHVQLSFGNGASLKDPAGVLLGGGKFRRHLNFKSPDDVDSKILLALLKQSIRL